MVIRPTASVIVAANVCDELAKTVPKSQNKDSAVRMKAFPGTDPYQCIFAKTRLGFAVADPEDIEGSLTGPRARRSDVVAPRAGFRTGRIRF